MLRSALLLATLTGPAHAWEDVQPVVATGETIQGLDVPVPLGFSFDPFVIDPIWVGIELTLGGNAKIGVELEGDATLRWGDELPSGTFVWSFEPAQTRLTLDNLGEFSVAVTIREVDSNGKVLLSQVLTGAQVTWVDELGVEDGALLPGDDPDELVVTKAGTGFSGINFNVGSFLRFTDGLTGEIQADGTVHGVRLATAVDSITTAGTPFEPGYGEPALDVKVGYEASVDLDLAYVFTADPTLSVNLGLFTIPIPVALKGQEIQAIEGTVGVEAVGETRHVFGHVGEVTAAVPPVDAGASTEALISIPNPADGPLIVQVVGVQGDDAEAFTASSAPFTVAPRATGTTSLGVITSKPGNLEATVELATNDPWNPTVFVPLTLTVRAPVVPEEDFTPDALPAVDGCGCAGGGSRPAVAGLAVLLLALRRRRHRA